MAPVFRLSLDVRLHLGMIGMCNLIMEGSTVGFTLIGQRRSREEVMVTSIERDGSGSGLELGLISLLSERLIVL